MPKAGTYLLASLCEEFGIANSGCHIGFTGYLDTLSHPADINRHRPSATRARQQYIKTFKQCAGQIAFGHLSPSFLPPGVFHATQVIASYRDPIEVLISEYNDYRFIRQDVNFCSRQTEPDDVLAFGLYLQRQAPVIRDILIEMGRYLDCFSQTLYAPKYRESLPLLINFNRLHDTDYRLWLDQLFSRFLPGCNTTFGSALKSTFGKQTKTKSQGYSFETEMLWSSDSLAMIKALRLKRLHRNLLDQEHVIQAALR
ncbi:MAG: hypothetical protein WBM08_09800 [Prochlorococcaceae cyanobacterium]